MAAVGFISIFSSRNFDATRHLLERACAAHGMTIFARIDHASAAADAGLQIRPTEVLMIGNACSGTPLMAKFPCIAIDLPLRILIWEDDGGYVHLGYNDPEWIVRRQTDDADLIPRIEAMRTALSDILADATV